MTIFSYAWAGSVILNWVMILAVLEPMNRKIGFKRTLRMQATSWFAALLGLGYTIFIAGQFYGAISGANYLRTILTATKHCPVCLACHQPVQESS